MLIKNTAVSSIISGTPGSPGSPGRAYSKGLCKTYTYSGLTSCPVASSSSNNSTNVGVCTSSGAYSYTFVYTYCLPDITYIPPTAAIPPTQAVFLSDTNTGWNGGAISIAVQTGSCVATFASSIASLGVFTGLLPVGAINNISNYTHAIYQSHSAIKFYESGVQVGSVVYVASSDVLSIRRIEGQVVYAVNGVPVRTSTKASSGAIHLATTLYTAGDAQL